MSYLQDLKAAAGRGGGVSHFSRASRNRMIEKVASFDFSSFDVYFLTLTYPRRFPPGETVKRHRRRLEKRFLRAFPGAGFLWKIELQKRGAPHFHCIVWLPCGKMGVEEVSGWFRKNWYGIVGSKDPHHFRYGVDITKMQSRRGVQSYCSKYCAKEGNGFYFGRQWGVVGFSPVQVVFFRCSKRDFFRFYEDFLVRNGRWLDGLEFARIFHEGVFAEFQTFLDSLNRCGRVIERVMK